MSQREFSQVNCQKYDTVDEFQQEVLEWWNENSRQLPWREDPTPYHVLVSEVMLQQTQVSRVVPKYLEFLEKFPDFESLANADTRHLLQVWSGLGYNRRALWLRNAAQEILRRGEFPKEEEELRELKGIGHYTSRSILIFAFNRDLATVDTNIRRVLISSGFATEEMSRSEVQDVAERLLPKGMSRDWHNALMDYGSLVLTSNATGITPKSTQSRFSGSSREIRGVVIQLMIENDEMTVNQLSSEIEQRNLDSTELMEIVGQLVEEGFLTYTDSGTLSIAG
ncbi:Fe-S cluster assembly protein HesB [Candidatus Thorarchaeota archaeon]|nr:MAG: Fe-S cluster assembly protein HesB [Candidatus Thorarchaeota archaeon]